jgi:hypothetical protein
MVITEGVTDINITNFLGGGPITSIGSINYPAGIPQKGYILTLSGGQVYLTIDNNLPSGGYLRAPDVTFNYTIGGYTATADIKAINVTPGNNANTLDLTNSAIGPYSFSYISAQPHGQPIVFAPGTKNVLAFTGTSDSTPAKFDTVSNFDPSLDQMDLSEIPGITSVHALGSFNAIPSGNIVAAHSIDWLIDKATNQTIVFVNNTATAHAAATASMKIILNGQLNLTPRDFVLSEPPLSLNVGSNTLTLPARGSVALPITVSPVDLDDTVAVKISGLASYETVTDNLDHTTFSGGKSGTVVLTQAEVNSGLTLNSSYAGTGKPVNTLTVTASNTTPGELATTQSQKIKVTDPPSSSGQNSVTAAHHDDHTTQENDHDDRAGQSAAGGNTTGLLASGTSGAAFRGIDLSGLNLGGNGTQAHLWAGADPGGTPAAQYDPHGRSLALFTQYLSSSFATTSDGHGGTPIIDPQLDQHHQLSIPHAG